MYTCINMGFFSYYLFIIFFSKTNQPIIKQRRSGFDRDGIRYTSGSICTYRVVL